MKEEWLIVDYHDSKHVLPNHDGFDHTVKERCKCGVVYEDGIYVHNEVKIHS